MTPELRLAGLGLLALAGGAAMVTAIRAPLAGGPAASGPIAPAVPLPTHQFDTAHASSWPALAPFRRSRRIARAPDRAAIAAAPPLPRPALVLRGIVLGRAPRALVEGLPGVEGARALQVGDQVGDASVAAISDSSIRLVARDTSWQVKLARVGQ